MNYHFISDYTYKKKKVWSIAHQALGAKLIYSLPSYLSTAMTSQRTEEEVPKGSEKTQTSQGENTQKSSETKNDTEKKTEGGNSAQGSSSKGESKEADKEGDKGEKEENKKSEEGSQEQPEDESGESKHGTEKAKVSKEALEGPQGEPARKFKTEAAPGGMCCRPIFHWSFRQANDYQMMGRVAPVKASLKTTPVRTRLATPRAKRRISLQMARSMRGTSDI